MIGSAGRRPFILAWNDYIFARVLLSADELKTLPVGIAGNPLAMQIMEILREGFSAFYRFKRFVPNREDQKLIWDHHFEIYDAVRRRAPEEARAAIVAHMDFIEGKLDEGVSEIDTDLNRT